MWSRTRWSKPLNEAFPRTPAIDSVDAWLLRIVHNTALDFLGHASGGAAGAEDIL